MQDSTKNSCSQQTTGSLVISRLSQGLQKLLDIITPFSTSRWIAAFVLVLVFMIRIVLLEGWYLIAYAQGVFYLILPVSLSKPKIIPIIKDFAVNLKKSGPFLPTQANEEFRPSIRRKLELKIWYSVVISTILSIFLTFFDFFNVPVFWPILVIYFFVLFVLKSYHILRIRKRKIIVLI